MNVIEKVFGTHSQRELKRLEPIVDKIEALRPDMMALDDAQLRDKTQEFKNRLADGETLDDLLPEAYAAVREAARRVLDMEHFRVQLIGGIVLHQGRIAEMKTGEGKTLRARVGGRKSAHLQLMRMMVGISFSPAYMVLVTYHRKRKVACNSPTPVSVH